MKELITFLGTRALKVNKLTCKNQAAKYLRDAEKMTGVVTR